MKVKIKRSVDVVDEIELPTFNKTFFRHQYFDGEKINSISYDGGYLWLDAKLEDIVTQNENITVSTKESFIQTVDKAIERLQDLKSELTEKTNV